MIGQVRATVGRPVTLTGYATDFDRAIAAVQFSLDGGRTWTTYETPGTSSERNLSWRFSYTPRRAGRYRMLIRSVNEDGVASPTPASVEFVAEPEEEVGELVGAVPVSRAAR